METKSRKDKPRHRLSRAVQWVKRHLSRSRLPTPAPEVIVPDGTPLQPSAGQPPDAMVGSQAPQSRIGTEAPVSVLPSPAQGRVQGSEVVAEGLSLHVRKQHGGLTGDVPTVPMAVR